MMKSMNLFITELETMPSNESLFSEEKARSLMTTMALGEEGGGPYTTMAIGEEGGGMI